jgi:acyl carrier protein
MQAGMVYHGLSHGDRGVYLQQVTFLLDGVADPARLAAAWQHVVDRTPVLRSEVAMEHIATPVQVVRGHATVPVSHLDWTELTEPERAERFERLLADDRAEGMDLGKAPLMRLAIARLSETQVRVVWTFHHLLLDGWSVFQVLLDVFACHAAVTEGRPPRLEVRRPYREYLRWLAAQEQREAESYWKWALSGFATPTALNYDRAPAPGHATTSTGALSVRLDEAESGALYEFARRHGLTVNSVVQGAWAVLLSRDSGRRDVCFGATISGRPPDLPGADRMTGLFINTVPVRVDVVSGPGGVVEWLRALQSAQAHARKFGYVSLAQLQAWSRLPRGAGLFDSIVVFENYPINEAAAAEHGLRLGDLRAVEFTNFPLHLIVSPGDRLLIEFGYDPQLFDETTIERLAAEFCHVLRCFIAGPEAELDRIDVSATAGRAAACVAPPTARRAVHVAPRTDTERVVAQFWAEALEVERVGVEDDFFLLGGDSLFSLAITAKIKAVFGVALTPRDVLTSRTVSVLAELVEEKVLRELEHLAASGTDDEL